MMTNADLGARTAMQLMGVGGMLSSQLDEAEEYHAHAAASYYREQLEESDKLYNWMVDYLNMSVQDREVREAKFREYMTRAHQMLALHTTMKCDCCYCQPGREDRDCWCIYCKPGAREREVAGQSARVLVQREESAPLRTAQDMASMPLDKVVELYQKVYAMKQEVEGEPMEQTFWERVWGKAPQHKMVLVPTAQAQEALTWRQGLPARLEKLVSTYEQALTDNVSESVLRDAVKLYDKARRDEERLEAEYLEKQQKNQDALYAARLLAASERSSLDLRDL